MRHRPVVECGLALEPEQVGCAALVAVPRPHVGAPGESRQRDVEVVGTSTHQAEAHLGDAPQRTVPPSEVVSAPGNEVADIDLFPGLGVGHQQQVGLVVLQVVQRSHRVGSAGQPGVGCHVVHPLPVEPDLAVVLEPLEILLTSPRSQVDSFADLTTTVRAFDGL